MSRMDAITKGCSVRSNELSIISTGNSLPSPHGSSSSKLFIVARTGGWSKNCLLSMGQVNAPKALCHQDFGRLVHQFFALVAKTTSPSRHS